MSKKDFLDNVRIARNLFVHPTVSTDSQQLDPAAHQRMLVRAAIWLAPSAVRGFRAEDFPELGPDKQRELTAAVQAFEQIAQQVPPDAPATDEQYANAAQAFARLTTILAPYLPTSDEEQQARTALATTKFPSWVLNWDYELGSDEDGVPGVWVTLYADEKSLPQGQFGRRVLETIPKLRDALAAANIRRWPYVRLRTGAEHKAS